MLTYLQEIDTQLFLYLNSLHVEWLDQLMALLTGRWIWIPFYIALSMMIYFRVGFQKMLIALVLIGLAIVVTGQICASVIRPYVARLRPANIDSPISDMVHIVNGYRGGQYGFPSCHASNTFCLAAFMSLLLKRKWITAMMISWALFQCYTRIYLGLHYPGDILAGAIVGSLIGSSFYLIYITAINKAPRLVGLKKIN